MKRSALILFTVMTLVSSCYEKELTGPRSDGMLYAQLEGLGDTRTSMDDSNNILWSEGDQIVAFMKTSLGARYQVTEESIGESSASFVEVSTGSGGVQTGNELEQNVLYYPYSSSVKCSSKIMRPSFSETNTFAGSWSMITASILSVVRDCIASKPLLYRSIPAPSTSLA